MGSSSRKCQEADDKIPNSFQSALLRLKEVAPSRLSGLPDDLEAKLTMGSQEMSPVQKATPWGHITIHRGSIGANKQPFIKWPYVGQMMAVHMVRFSRRIP